MKRDIGWHTTCLLNRKNSLEEMRIALKYMQSVYDKMQTDYHIYEDQIERAKRENLDGFDRDKYNKKRKIKKDEP